MKGIELSNTFTVGDIEFINFGTDEKTGGIIGVARHSLFDHRFGPNDNFAVSDVLDALNDRVLPKLVEDIGEENLLEFEVDLLDPDRPNHYANLTTKIAIPTRDFYNNYGVLFDEYSMHEYWWLCSPIRGNVHYVTPNGWLDWGAGLHNKLGVRPMCIFNPEIFGIIK